MFFIEQISNKIGSKISSNLNLDKDTQEIITYGAFAVLQILWSFLCVVILGYICNVLLESIIISLVIAVFRKYSGGYMLIHLINVQYLVQLFVRDLHL